MHYRSLTCWELLHPFAHHCQHARNNSQRQQCWELLRPFARSFRLATSVVCEGGERRREGRLPDHLTAGFNWKSSDISGEELPVKYWEGEGRLLVADTYFAIPRRWEWRNLQKVTSRSMKRQSSYSDLLTLWARLSDGKTRAKNIPATSWCRL